jgi:hypothetical protein
MLDQSISISHPRENMIGLLEALAMHIKQARRHVEKHSKQEVRWMDMRGHQIAARMRGENRRDCKRGARSADIHRESFKAVLRPVWRRWTPGLVRAVAATEVLLLTVLDLARRHTWGEAVEERHNSCAR